MVLGGGEKGFPPQLSLVQLLSEQGGKGEQGRQEREASVLSAPAHSLQGQNMVMILKKDTMSLVDPLDHSLIHCQPIINIRVWGVGCNNGR